MNDTPIAMQDTNALQQQSDPQWQSTGTPKSEAGQRGDDATSAQATHTAQVTGPVEYRAGDGPTLCVPEGPVTIDLTETDATLSWDADDARQSTAIPRDEFKRYLDSGAIRLDA